MSGTNSGLPTPTNRRLAGLTSVHINGAAYAVIEYTWAPGRIQRETMLSLSGVDGFSAKPAIGHISVKLRDTQAVNVTSFNSMEDATVVLKLANGKSVVGHNMWNVPMPEVGQEASFDVRFEGDDVSEQGIAA